MIANNNFSKKRIETIDILKGIAILTVVIGHSGFGTIVPRYFSSFHMQIFFVLSGFLYVPGKFHSLSELLKRKAKTLLIPYVFFASITIISCLLITGIYQSNYFDFPYCLVGLVYSNRSIFPINGGLWFLQCLFLVEVMFWIIESKVSRRISFFIIVILWVLAFLQSKYAIVLPFSLDSALSAIVFYYIGYKIRNQIKRIIHKKEAHKLRLVTMSIFFLILGVILAFINEPVNPRTCEYGNYFLYYVCALSTIVGLAMAVRLLETVNLKCVVVIKEFLIKCGKDSIVFLGFNQLAISSLYWTLNQLFTYNTMLQKGCRNIFICILSIIMLYFITCFFSGTVLRLLIGKKNEMGGK